MSHHESRAHTLIVRMRFEPRLVPGARGEWRGEIERVPGGTRRFFRHVEGIVPALRELVDEPEDS